MKIKNPELLVRLICVAALVIIGIGISVSIKEPKEEQQIEVTSTPTPTNVPTPSPTATPTPTSTPTPSPTNTPTPTATPTPEPERVEVPNVSDVLIKEAYEYVQNYLETFAKEEKTLYNTYTEKELELLFRVVEAEITGGSLKQKTHVASVIFNRLKAGWCGGDLTKNLMAKRQFEVVTNGRYLRVEVQEDTILACEIAFKEDTAQGALYFDSTKGKSWAHKNCEFIFSDGEHWFYK